LPSRARQPDLQFSQYFHRPARLARPEKLWLQVGPPAYPLQMRQEQGRRMILRAEELMRLAFRPRARRAADLVPVIFRLGPPLKVAVSVVPAQTFWLAARGARALQRRAVTFRAAGSCRGRDARRGLPRGAS
jgi:hypothetical protein